MHRTISYISKRFVQLRPGEGRKVLLTFFFFFFVITAYYVIKPVQRALILNDIGFRDVPYFDLICAILMGPIVTIFARLVDRVSKPKLVGRSFWVVAGVMVLFWGLLAWPKPWVSGAFYVWVAIFSVLIVTLFWLVANDLYRPRDAKRLFGFIGSGGILGGVAGSTIAAIGAQVIGTRHLLLLSAALLVVCWAIVQQLWAFAPERIATQGETLATPHRDTFLSNLGSFAKILLRSRYLLLLIALVGLGKIVTTFVSYQFNPFIESRFLDVDAKTTFMGLFLGGVNVVAFIVQFVFTSWTLRRLGLLWALLILPLGLVIGNVGLALIPVFWIAASMELYARSLSYSLHNTAKEVLYLPIERSIRYKVKPFIDMVVFRFGKGIAAVLGILFLKVWEFPASIFGSLAIPLLGCMLLVAMRMRWEYTFAIRNMLKERKDTAQKAMHGAAIIPEVHDMDEGEVLSALITDRPRHEKLSLAARLVTNESDSTESRALLDALGGYEEPPAGVSLLEGGFNPARLKETVQDRSAALGLRLVAVKMLASQDDQQTFDGLCDTLTIEKESALRHEVVRALVKMRATRPTLQTPGGQLRRQIAKEVDQYVRIRRVAMAYQQQSAKPLAPNDPVIGMLRILLEEAVEQIFRLLTLLYRPEDICLVYRQLRAADAQIRADAVELLDNLVDPTLRASIFPILDENRFLSLMDDDDRAMHEPALACEVLRDSIWDSNQWLSVTTLCAVGRLRVQALHSELQDAARHDVPLVSMAAKVALHLAEFP